jgi:hypothetical protein
VTPKRFRIVKHLTAALFATAMAGLFVLGVDGLLRGVHELTRLFGAPPPAAAPAADSGATPGVVPTFIVPAKGDASGEAASRKEE